MRHGKVGYCLDGFELTEQSGAYALGVMADDDWYTDQPIALVSSLECFWGAEYLGEHEPIGAFVHVDEEAFPRLVEWLQRGRRTPKLYLYFDFDTYGLQKMDSIIRWVPEAQVFLPHNFKNVWRDHAQLSHFNPEHFDGLKKNLALHNPAVQAVFNAIAQSGAGMKLDSLVLAEKNETFH